MTSLLKVEPSVFVYELELPSSLAPEDDESGTVEYKRTLSFCSEKKALCRATQLLWRLSQSDDSVATYFLGVEDCGRVSGISIEEMNSSLRVLDFMCGEIGASVTDLGISTTGTDSTSVVEVRVACRVDVRLEREVYVSFDI